MSVSTQPPQGKSEKYDESDVKDENTGNDDESNQANNQTIKAQQAIQEYIKEKKIIYDSLIKYLENEDNNDQNFKNLIYTNSQQKHEEPQEGLKKFLQLLTSISNNCHRNKTLFDKIFQLIEFYEDQIKQSFTNIEVFNIFNSNKKLLHFLFKIKIITINDTICNELFLKQEPNFNSYRHFFYPEIKNFIGKDQSESLEKELQEKDSNIFEHFEEKREEGENDTILCSLIRKDSIEEFITYINSTNISLNSYIKPSIFETNAFLNENKNISLIEYASFFGSIQIIQYLILNKVELKPSLWLYMAHSRNAELFHLFEENKIDLPEFEKSNKEGDFFKYRYLRRRRRRRRRLRYMVFEEEEDNDSKHNNTYLKCFCEFIKCHHNEFANYIEDNFLLENKDQIRNNEFFLSHIMEFHNYAYFPSNFDNGEEFYYLCSNDYHKLVNLFIQKKEESMKKEIIEKIHNY